MQGITAYLVSGINCWCLVELEPHWKPPQNAALTTSSFAFISLSSASSVGPHQHIGVDNALNQYGMESCHWKRPRVRVGFPDGSGAYDSRVDVDIIFKSSSTEVLVTQYCFLMLAFSVPHPIWPRIVIHSSQSITTSRLKGNHKPYSRICDRHEFLKNCVFQKAIFQGYLN